MTTTVELHVAVSESLLTQVNFVVVAVIQLPALSVCIRACVFMVVRGGADIFVLCLK